MKPRLPRRRKKKVNKYLQTYSLYVFTLDGAPKWTVFLKQNQPTDKQIKAQSEIIEELGNIYDEH